MRWLARFGEGYAFATLVGATFVDVGSIQMGFAAALAAIAMCFNIGQERAS